MTPQSSSGSSAGAVATLTILALAMAMGFTVMGSFSTVQESAKAELALSDYALSSIQGLAAALPLAFLSVPIGMLVDRWNRARLLAVLVAIWTAGTFLTALAPNGQVLFAGRMLTGIGTTGGLTAALSLAADCCTPDRRGRAMLIVTMGKTLGVAAAFALTGTLFGWAQPEWLGMAPWRAAHVMLGLWSAVSLLAILMLREPPRREIEAAGRLDTRIVFAELWARRAFLLPLFAGQAAVVMADAAAGIWAAPVLSRAFGLTPDQFAVWLGALLLGTGVLGTLVGGFAADWGHRSRVRGGMLIGMIIAAALGVPAALFPIAPDVTLFAIGLGLMMFGGTITGLIMSAALTVYLPNELRGLSIGLFIAVAGLVGYGVAPTLVVLVSDLLGGESHLAAALALVGCVISLLSVIGIVLAMRHAPIGAQRPEAIAQPI